MFVFILVDLIFALLNLPQVAISVTRPFGGIKLVGYEANLEVVTIVALTILSPWVRSVLGTGQSR